MQAPSRSHEGAQSDDRGFPAPGSLRDLAILAGMVTLALAVRLIPVLRGGGLFGTMTYDDGVYFGSAVALLDGRIPYRDFLLLHPPGILIVLAPFAALGHLIGDPAAFASSRLAFMVLGAVNVVLVTLVASRAGRRAALVAGALYVVWEGAANVERTTWLIAPQSTLLLLALLALAGPRRRPESWVPGVRRCAVAGLLLGLNVGIQVWGVVPLAIVLGWLVAIHRRRLRASLGPVLTTGFGAVVAVAIVWGPFLLVAGPQMVRYVVLDQAGRSLGHATIVDRMRSMEAFSLHHGNGHWVPNILVVAIYVTAVVAIAWAARRRPVSRLWAAILAAQVGVLFLAPPFPHYSGWLAPTAALMAGCVADSLLALTESRRWIHDGMRATFAVGLVGLLAVSTVRPVGTRLSVGKLDAELAGERCVTSDFPTVLIETGALTRDLQHGCPLLLDPTGLSYDVGQLKVTTRSRDAAYQAAMAAYYGNSDAAMFARLKNDAFPASTLDAIRQRLPTDSVLGRVKVMVDGGD